jgi:hypothetical protein
MTSLTMRKQLVVSFTALAALSQLSEIGALSSPKQPRRASVSNFSDEELRAPSPSPPEAVPVATTSRAPEWTVPPDVKISSSSDLPSLHPNSLLDVYYAEQVIKELGTVGELVETYHSGLIFRFREGGKVQGVPNEFTVQWYAFDFPFGAFLPKVGKGLSDLAWNNTACAHYTPAVDPHRWTKGEQLVGTITGEAFNAFAKWTVEYCSQRPGYQAFDVWNHPLLVPNKTIRWAESNTCSSFTEAALIKLYNLGGDFKGGKEVLRRSYVPLIGHTKPTEIDMKNPQEAKKVKEFYEKIQKVVVGNEMSTSEFIRFLADKLDVFYVYESHRDVYLGVNLSPPYLALAQLYQPMSLPWQRLDLDVDGIADYMISAFAPESATKGDFVSELSGAVTGSMDLLQRRLPQVLLRRIGPKLFPSMVGVVLVPVVIFFVFTNGVNVHMDDSFVAGVLVGLAVGTILGSRFLKNEETNVE